MCTSIYKIKDKMSLFDLVFFRGWFVRRPLLIFDSRQNVVFLGLSCLFTFLVFSVLICAICGTWCSAGCYRSERIMTEKTLRYFERHFKIPFVKTIPKAGIFNLPVLPKCEIVPNGIVCFDQVKPETNRNQFLHTHTTDDKLESMWLNPERYLRRFSEFQGIYPPDFSQYTDMDRPASIWNLYRMRVMSAYYSVQGLHVMLVATWNTPDSFPYTFDGLPQRGMIGVSTVGVLKNPRYRKLFAVGYAEMVKRLKPEIVVLYGGDPGFDLGGPETLSFPNSHYSWRKEVRHGI